MVKVDVYTKPWCPYSGRATNVLDRLGIQYNEININNDQSRESEMHKRSGRQTVPQIFVGNVHLGGSDDLLVAERTGLLEGLVFEKN